MKPQEHINFNRIAEAIEYLTRNFKDQPDLDVVAKKVHLSPFHFQRLFTDWAGVSPKKFLQFLTIEYAKAILKEKQSSLFDAAFETGLAQGVLFERRLFHSLFATEDQKEGMAAFAEKRQPEFKHR